MKTIEIFDNIEALNQIESDTMVVLKKPLYYLSEPIVIKNKKNIIVTSDIRSKIHCTIKQSEWVYVGEGIYSSSCFGYDCDGVIIGKNEYHPCRYPKYTDSSLPYGGYAQDCILPEKTKEWKNPKGGYIHAMHRHLWGGYTYEIMGKNSDGSLMLEGGWQNNRQMGMHDDYRYAENIREELTEKGEFYFDKSENRVYIIPFEDDVEKLNEAEIIVNDCFVDIIECENVKIENIILAHSKRTFMKTKEPLLRSDWTIYRGGAVHILDSINCSVSDCDLYNIGSNGVFIDGRSENITVERCMITKTGASGICFVGSCDSVRDALFEYNETNSVNDISLEKGPKNDNYVKNCTVSDCYLSYIGLTEKQATGVEISVSYGITVESCTICHTSRAGINISEGTFGGHKITGCDVFDTVRETGDHGSFNSWGRDRFWHLRDLDDSEAYKYASLDSLGMNVIENSRFRCDKGWDIDLDDGSSHYIIRNNVCLNGGIKLREGFDRHVYGNITVNNTVHFHVWYPNSMDTVENNIIFTPYAPIGMNGKWGDRVDNNILYSPDITNIVKAEEFIMMSGDDANSIKKSIVFVSPETCDYRTDGAEGFESIPVEFGVRCDRLKKLADTPVLPVIEIKAENKTSEILSYLDMEIRNILNDGEMSVYGTSGHEGALVVSVKDDSILQIGDVIVAIDNNDIKSIYDIDLSVNPVTITVLRKQVKTVIEL